MKFTKYFLNSLFDSGSEVCLFSTRLVALLKNYSNNSFSQFSSRSFYFWKKQKRPIPLSVALRIMDERRVDKINIEYFSTKGGNKIKIPPENLHMMYLFGIILGDGCFVHSQRKKRNSWYIQITSNSINKIKFLQKIAKRLFSVNPVYYKIKNYYNLYIFSKPLVMILSKKYEIPIGLKYEKIKVPKVVKDRETWKKAFIKGLFETDGNIYNYRGKKGLQLRQKSKSFLEEVRDLCKGIHIVFNPPYYDKANNSWVLWTCKKEVVDTFIKKIEGLVIRAR